MSLYRENKHALAERNHVSLDSFWCMTKLTTFRTRNLRTTISTAAKGDSRLQRKHSKVHHAQHHNIEHFLQKDCPFPENSNMSVAILAHVFSCHKRLQESEWSLSAAQDQQPIALTWARCTNALCQYARVKDLG